MTSEACEAALDAALQNCGNVDAFLDNVFGFLARRTDFYVECPPEGGRFGFPPGHAESLVRSNFVKWKKYFSEQSSPLLNFKAPSPTTSSVQASCQVNEVIKSTNVVDPSATSPSEIIVPKCLVVPDEGGNSGKDDAHNGRVTEKYSWSQTIAEVDVTIPIGQHVRKGKQMQVMIESGRIFIAETGSIDSPIVEGNLSFPVKKDDCYWNLLPGECVRIWLQKSQERWWQALLEGEELLEMSQIEAVRPMEELDQEEQMKIQELCWNEERKRQGLPTSEDMKMQEILEKAWNADGSPFKGTPIDPSIIQFSPQNQSTFFSPQPDKS
ncbi:nudC domain-containing protein 3 isoform X1 [Folsomia candida]|uniref:nudC domain-containing protein 3 isoform X1 n=1 Tax=Folsomia candida TaxID=158441 RepID=UPI000B9052DC|nr:nudC domain-containing protein 3 isoform X1 [Folsomia candida]